MSARDQYTDMAASNSLECAAALDEIDRNRFRLVGVSQVMESVRALVVWLDAGRDPLELAGHLNDLRASFFAYLYAQANPGEVDDDDAE